MADLSLQAHHNDWHPAEQTPAQQELHLHLSSFHRTKEDIATHQNKTLEEISFQKMQISQADGDWTSTIQTSNTQEINPRPAIFDMSSRFQPPLPHELTNHGTRIQKDQFENQRSPY